MFNQEDTLDVKERILLVAKDLFTKNGFKGTSIRDIATKADTNVAMVNYYFQSKYNLFEIIFEQTLDILFERIFSNLTSDKPFFELVEAWISSYFEFLTEYPYMPTFLLNEVTLNPQRLTDRIQHRSPYGVYLKVSERIKQEVEKGAIKPTPALDFMLNVVSLCVFPFIVGNLARPMAGVTQDDYDKMLEEHRTYVAEFVINAIKA